MYEYKQLNERQRVKATNKKQHPTVNTTCVITCTVLCVDTNPVNVLVCLC